jgi:hypothetical protein
MFKWAEAQSVEGRRRAALLCFIRFLCLMAIQLTTDRRANAGCCNFCQRGEPNAAETNLIFPYAYVALLDSDLAQRTGSMRLCPQCLSELRRQLETFELPDTGPEPDTSVPATKPKAKTKEAAGKRTATISK